MVDCLFNKVKNNNFIYRKCVKDRIVNKLKFFCKGILKIRVKVFLIMFRNVIKIQKLLLSLNMGFKLYNNEIYMYC